MEADALTNEDFTYCLTPLTGFTCNLKISVLRCSQHCRTWMSCVHRAASGRRSKFWGQRLRPKVPSGRPTHGENKDAQAGCGGFVSLWGPPLLRRLACLPFGWGVVCQRQADVEAHGGPVNWSRALFWPNPSLRRKQKPCLPAAGVGDLRGLYSSSNFPPFSLFRKTLGFPLHARLDPCRYIFQSHRWSGSLGFAVFLRCDSL